MSRWPLTAKERFWSVVDRSGECWTWTAARNEFGYGRFYLNGRTEKAHRVSWAWENGAVPQGMELDHLCRNRACVRPDHMEAVTHRENVLRGESPTAANQAREECRKGHPYTPENTYRPEPGRRRCRTCDRDRQRRYYHEKKEAVR